MVTHQAEKIWLYDRTTIRLHKVLLLTCVVNFTAGTPTPRLCPVVLAGQGIVSLRRAGKKMRAPLLGLAKSIYYVVVDLIRPLTLRRRVFVFLYSNNRQKFKCRWFSWDKSSFQGIISYLFIRAQWLANDIAPPTFSYFTIFFFIEIFEKNPKKFHFYQPRLVPALLLPKEKLESFQHFLLLCFLSIGSWSIIVMQPQSWCIRPLYH